MRSSLRGVEELWGCGSKRSSRYNMQGTRPNERDATDTPYNASVARSRGALPWWGSPMGDGRRQGCHARSWRSVKTITWRLSRVKGKSAHPSNQFDGGEGTEPA